MKCSENCNVDMNCIDCPAFDTLVERLAAYEDTDWTPEEIDMDHEAAEELRRLCRDYDLERLENLIEADKNGRVVVLPCKVGDTVYRVITIKGENPVVLETQVKTVGQAADAAQLIGKKNKVINIFLTREEAEKALEAMQNGTVL